MYYTIEKIKNKYTDNNIKKIINKYLKKILLYTSYIKNKLQQMIKPNSNENIVNEKIQMEKLDEYSNDYALLTNIFDLQ